MLKYSYCLSDASDQSVYTRPFFSFFVIYHLLIIIRLIIFISCLIESYILRYGKKANPCMIEKNSLRGRNKILKLVTMIPNAFFCRSLNLGNEFKWSLRRFSICGNVNVISPKTVETIFIITSKYCSLANSENKQSDRPR